jgi:hypothetical protein
VVHGSKLTSVGSRCVLVFGLCCCRPCMLLVRVSFFLLRRSSAHSTRTIEASAVYRGVVVNHRLVIDIVNLGHVHVIHRSVVVEIVSPPISALITFSPISIAVIYSAVETHVGSPVTVIPYVCPVVPSPVTGCPQVAGRRREHPGAGNPVIIFIIVAVSPVAGRPDIIISGTNRLHVHRQRRGRDSDRYSNLPERYRWYEQHHYC